MFVTEILSFVEMLPMSAMKDYFQIAECCKSGGKGIIKSWLVGLSACYFYVKISPPSKKLSFVCHALSAFKSSLNHNSPESRFLPILWSSLMTGACHLLRPASVFIDDRLLAQEDCSFDCRCKDTKIRSRKQAFPRRILKICCKWLICSDISICGFYI